MFVEMYMMRQYGVLIKDGNDGLSLEMELDTNV